MYRYFDLILISIILFIITIVIGINLYKEPWMLSLSLIALSILAIPLYKSCIRKRKPLHKNTFWEKDWHQNRCTYIMIMYGISSASIVVYIFKKMGNGKIVMNHINRKLSMNVPWMRKK